MIILFNESFHSKEDSFLLCIHTMSDLSPNALDSVWISTNAVCSITQLSGDLRLSLYVNTDTN